MSRTVPEGSSVAAHRQDHRKACSGAEADAVHLTELRTIRWWRRNSHRPPRSSQRLSRYRRRSSCRHATRRCLRFARAADRGIPTGPQHTEGIVDRVVNLSVAVRDHVLIVQTAQKKPLRFNRPITLTGSRMCQLWCHAKCKPVSSETTTDARDSESPEDLGGPTGTARRRMSGKSRATDQGGADRCSGDSARAASAAHRGAATPVTAHSSVHPEGFRERDR